MASVKKVSLSPIGEEIRNSQEAMRAARKGAPAAMQRKLNARIRKLSRHHAQIKMMCKSWDPRF